MTKTEMMQQLREGRSVTVSAATIQDDPMKFMEIAADPHVTCSDEIKDGEPFSMTFFWQE